MTLCQACQAGVEVLLDLGRQPYSNRFPASREAPEAQFRMQLGQCGQCGLIQLMNPPPAAEITPRVDWIQYNEAEAHLDTLAAKLNALLGDNRSATILGLSYKDSSLLSRLRALGYSGTHGLTPNELGIHNPCAGLETIQHVFTPELAKRLGSADVVIARHVLEHAQNQKTFVAALKQLLKPGGWLVVEVPDFARALATLDYSAIWEEHVVYFSPEQFGWTLRRHGFTLQEFLNFPYPLENGLVAICRNIPPDSVGATPSRCAEILASARRYRDQFAVRRSATQAALEQERKHPGAIAMFGAGHLAAKFIDFLELGGLIDRVIDDHPRKKGLCMPGSRLPIVGSDCLARGEVRLCLSSLNPESESKVREKLAAYLDGGGRFESIFPSSSTAFMRTEV